MKSHPSLLAVQQIRRTILQSELSCLTDGQLLDWFLNEREQAAFDALVRKHAGMVWGVCHRILANHADAEDAFQATFLVLVRKAASIEPRGQVANWLYGVASKTARKSRALAMRRGLREQQVPFVPERSCEPYDNWADLGPVLHQELNLLPIKYRAPIILCDLRGNNRQEAARELRLPDGTLSSRLARGRRLLAAQLTRRGITLSVAALASVLGQEAASANVPPGLIAETIRSINGVGADSVLCSGSSGYDAFLIAKRVLQTMLLAKLWNTAAVLILAGAVGTGAVAITLHASAASEGQTPGGLAGDRPTAAQAPKSAKEDPAVQPSLEAMAVFVAAWENAGAEFGWIKTSEPNGTGNEFVSIKQNLEGGPQDNTPLGADDTARGYYVAVRFQTFPRGKLRTLPMRERCLRFILSDTSTTDKDLEELTSLENLQWLHLAQSKITDAGLKHLSGLHKLERLGLPFHDGVTDAGMKYLAGLRNLQALNLSSTRVGDAGLKELADLKKLQHLNLAGTSATDAGLAELVGLKHLQTLYVGRTKVTDAGLRDLAQLVALQRLGLSGTQVSDRGLKQLVGLKKLRALNLRETEVTEAGLNELRESLPDCNMSR